MNDDRNRELAQVTKADDFVVSDKLISLLMTQLSENRHLAQVFADLFDPTARRSTSSRRRTTSSRRAGQLRHRLRGGRRRRDRDRLPRPQGSTNPRYGVVLNPPKDEDRSPPPGPDRVIVLAED